MLVSCYAGQLPITLFVARCKTFMIVYNYYNVSYLSLQSFTCTVGWFAQLILWGGEKSLFREVPLYKFVLCTSTSACMLRMYIGHYLYCIAILIKIQKTWHMWLGHHFMCSCPSFSLKSASVVQEALKISSVDYVHGHSFVIHHSSLGRGDN